ncbi:biotin synthetase [Legionella beliardensis]|uniref:Biotin synthase n=1 Tax=Legionella beliardensis TaxID=91822 RepID=A0A378I165_9GAMM|nr:biotin synthetase [Legionella beliardensis]
MDKQIISWTKADIEKIYTQPFNDLLFQAHQCHRQHHSANQLQLAVLLNIKTGACPEDCGYCSQSGHYKTAIQKENLLSVEEVMQKAQEAKAKGATRFCMGAAWRSPPAKAMPKLVEIIQEIKALGLETCMTLGMLSTEQATTLQQAGLDFYNHNIDTSPSYYDKVVTTRTFDDRLATIDEVRKSGMKVCCGGILGLGESREDRIEFLHTLVNLPSPPESIPINSLIPVEGTPLAQAKPIDPFELVRTIATARLLMPGSMLRLSAGRTKMSDELQALCYFAGANSVWAGDKLLTQENPQLDKDEQLFNKLGLQALPA